MLFIIAYNWRIMTVDARFFVVGFLRLGGFFGDIIAAEDKDFS